jgi:hypothetical protein
MSIEREPSPELAELLEQITPENTHGPVFENLIGAEAW